MKYTKNHEWILEILNRSTLKRTNLDKDSYIENLVNEVLTSKNNVLEKQTETDSEPDQDIDEDIDYDEAGFPQDILEPIRKVSNAY